MNATKGKWVLRLIEVLPDSDMYMMGHHQFSQKPSTEEILRLIDEVKAPRYELVGLVDGDIKVLMEDLSPIVGENFTITTSLFTEDADHRKVYVRGTLDGLPFTYSVSLYEENVQLYEYNSFIEDEDFERAEELENLIGHFFENNTYAYIHDTLNGKYDDSQETKTKTESDSK